MALVVVDNGLYAAAEAGAAVDDTLCGIVFREFTFG